MIRVGLAALVAAAVLLSGGSARAALPAYVQKNLTVTYSGSTTCSPASECFNGTVTSVSLAYTVQSTAGNSATVQTNNGGPFACTDGTVCASFFQFWVDPATPIYFMSNVDQNAGQQLAVTTAGCASTQLCMSFSNSNTSGGNTTRRSANLKFDANSGILISYVSTVVNVANGTSLQQDQTTTTSFNLASPSP